MMGHFRDTWTVQGLCCTNILLQPFILLWKEKLNPEVKVSVLDHLVFNCNILPTFSSITMEASRYKSFTVIAWQFRAYCEATAGSSAVDMQIGELV